MEDWEAIEKYEQKQTKADDSLGLASDEQTKETTSDDAPSPNTNLLLWQVLKLIVFGATVVFQFWGFILLGIHVDWIYMVVGFSLVFVSTIVTAIEEKSKE